MADSGASRDALCLSLGVEADTDLGEFLLARGTHFLESVPAALEFVHFAAVAPAWVLLRGTENEVLAALLLLRDEPEFGSAAVFAVLLPGGHGEVLAHVQNATDGCLFEPVDLAELELTLGAAADRARPSLDGRLLAEGLPSGFSLVRDIAITIRRTNDVEPAASFLAKFCPQPTRQALGISELLMNAIEHGNLEIDGAEKARLLESGEFDAEIARRLDDPRYASREATVWLRHFRGHVELVCEDQGPGFDWRVAEAAPEPPLPNGRGIELSRAIAFDSVQHLGRGNVVVAIARKERSTRAPRSVRELSSWEKRALQQQADSVLEGVLDEQFFRAALELCLSATESPHGFVGYLDDAGDLILPAYCDGRSDGPAPPVKFPRSGWNGVWAEVLFDQATRVKNRAHSVPHAHFPIDRSMGTPIMHRGRLVGSVHVANRTRPYSAYDALRLETIAARLAGTIAARVDAELAKEARRALELERARLDEEQSMALHLMRSLLREGCLDAPCIRARLSSKDLFNGDMALAAKLPGGGLRVMLGDFVGHGLPAAIGGLPLASIFYATARKGVPLAEVVSTMNDSLFSLLQRGHFCGAVLIDLDHAGEQLHVWNGGMPPGLLISAASGEIRELPSLHLPLGTVSSADLEIEIAHYDAEPHDLVLCLSDGLPETRDPRGELFGMARAKQALTEAPSAERFDRLLKALDDFRGFQQSADDVSLVAVTFGAALDWVIEF